jgi:ribosomal protein S18 acetylase RimI-like enzyme
MVQFRRSFSFGEAGTLRVEPVAEEWVPAAADLLTDTFAESMGYVAVYTNFLRRQIRKYLMAHMNLPPKTVVLIAILVPPADAEAAPDVAGHAERAEPSGAAPEDAAPSGWLPEGMAAAGRAGGEAPASPAPPRGAAAVVVGAVEVSFTAATRARFLTLNSPPDRPYLCNMAIADRHRGRGYGAALLAAAEELVVEAGESAVFLHVRLQDPPARALYTKAGYVPQAEDWPLVRLVGQDPRFLLKKELPPSGRSWLG